MDIIKPLLLCWSLFSFIAPSASALDLEYDAKMNEVEVYGPYLKYNFFNPPFSLGLNPFDKKDLALDLNTESESLEAQWPLYFPKSGKISLYGPENKRLSRSTIDPNRISSHEKSFSYPIPVKMEKIKNALTKGIQFCVENETKESQIEFCSDRLVYRQEKWAPLQISNKILIRLNGKKVPANAQVNLDLVKKSVAFFVKFESGLKISVRENIAKFGIEKLIVNPEKRTIGIISPQGIRQPNLSFSKKIKRALSEKNYFLDKVDTLKLNEQPITEEEFEFANPSGSFSLQTFGVSFHDRFESPGGIQFSATDPVATYSSKISIPGIKADSISIKGRSDDSLSQQGNTFVWKFKTPLKGTFNTESISVKKSDGDTYTHYNAKVFRGHRGSVAVRAAVASSSDFKIVPGVAIEADYWPEKVIGSSSFLSQRWGVSAGFSTTSADLKADAFGENLTQTNTYISLMGRFSKGVRPIKSSFGMGAKLFNPALTGGSSLDVDPQLLGFGFFWHSAPQLIVDQIVNVVPFFNFPKWMELSAYYYPIATNADFSVSSAFSLHARGRLMFSRNWFIDANMNLHSLNFEKDEFDGDISYLEGSFGIGYNF